MRATLDGMLLKAEQRDDGSIRGELLQEGSGRSEIAEFSALPDRTTGEPLADAVALLRVPRMTPVTMEVSITLTKNKQLFTRVLSCELNGYSPEA